jgi:ATP adenylyltransferase
MDHLWTPWRFHYIASDKSQACVFCDMQRDQETDEDHLILLRESHCFAVLNRFPYTSGHLMIVARRHLSSLTDATEGELSQMILLARDLQKALDVIYRPDGFNIGFNLGKSAGAGIAGHLHLHLVPRWQGDSNFVAVLGETRLIPEDLQTTYRKLRDYLHRTVGNTHP